MDTCKRYWNTCQTSLASVAGRATLLDQSVELLQILATLSSRRSIVWITPSRINLVHFVYHRKLIQEIQTRKQQIKQYK